MSLEENKKYEEIGKILSGESQGSEHANTKDFDALWMAAGKYEYSEAALNVTAWDNIKNQLTVKQEVVLKTTWIRRYAWAAAAAVSLLLVGGAGAWLASTKGEVETVASITVSTGNNEFKTIDLADGSKISMNSNSTVVVASGFNSKNRKITLNGQANFEVSPNKMLPFEVVAGSTTTKVLGTGFDIQAYTGEDVKIAVSHGKVSFGKGNVVVYLQKNEGALFSHTSGALNKIENAISPIWQNGEWILKKVKLSEIAEMFKHRFGKTLIHEATDADRQFTGKFASNATAEEIVATLEAALRLELIVK